MPLDEGELSAKEWIELCRRALARRRSLLDRLAAETTDCYRLLHGIAEGRPGLAVDRYGPILLAQTWREPLTPEGLEVLGAELGPGLTLVWNHRREKRAERFREWHDVPFPSEPRGSELGISFDVRPRHRGLDPLLFLDFRAARRRLRARCRGKTVLNLFAYTCGAGLAAAAGGASEVWNLDFARSALEVGGSNARANGLAGERFRILEEDVFPALRQLAGLPVKGRAAQRRKYAKLDPRRFDVVVLDPPKWSKSPFGAVDLVRDYPSLLKPALLATGDGGELLVSNNAPEVDRDAWIDLLERTARKCGRPIEAIELILPEEDFPSPDGRPPLKMAWLKLRSGALA